MTLFLIVLFAALVFEYINGFHDAANAIATVVSTKVLTPRQAILMAAFFNLIGALMGTAVATTIGKGLVDTQTVTMATVLAALIGAIVIQSASHFGIPLSTTHVISSSIMGVGASKRLSAVKWGLVSRIIWAWVLTLPITGLIGYLSCRLLHWFGCN